MPAKPRSRPQPRKLPKRSAGTAGKVVPQANGSLKSVAAKASKDRLREIELVAPPPKAQPEVARVSEVWPLAAQPTWFQRLRTWLRWHWTQPAPAEPRSDAPVGAYGQQMADVQAAVQQALADRAGVASSGEAGASRRAAGEAWADVWATGQRWRTRSRPWRGRWGLRRWSRRNKLIVAGLVLLALLVVIYQGHTPTGPAQAVASIHHSIVKGDVAGFERQVDVAAVATSAINQLFWSPESAMGSEAAALLPGTVGRAGPVTPTKLAVLRGDLKSQLETYIKPGLADSLKNEMVDAVARRSWRASRQADPDTLLLRLWQSAGGEHLELGETRILSADAERAAAEIMLSRNDLKIALPLRLELDRSEGVWQLVDLPNLVEVLNALSQAGTQAVTRASAQAVDEIGRLVAISDVTKARTGDGQLLVGVRLINTGPVNLRNLKIQLVFADAAGQPMKVALLEEPGVLASGALRQKTWAVMIDPRSSQERYVRDLPLDALSVKAGVIGVTLPGGRRLSTEPLVLQKVEE